MGATKSQIYDENMYNKPIEGITLTEGSVSLNGRNIHVSRWTPISPKAVVIVSHGLHEHGMRYHSVAESLAAKGYLVVALDHSSHGLSDGVRGLITDYTALPKDFVSLCKEINKEFETLPLFLLCHSMGTLIVSLSLRELPFVKAVCFSGCPLSPGPSSSSPFGLSFLYPLSQTSFAPSLARFLAFLSPKGAAAPMPLWSNTSDLEEQAIILKDSRRYDGDIMNKSAYEILKMINAVKLEIPSINVPFLAIHGALDSIAYPKGSEYLLENTGTDKKEKTYFEYENSHHEIFHETHPIKQDSINKVVDYFESQFVYISV
eukprot:CAMPEP_0119046484 /NCGR_PEP_ID=MMETSP1177-20130426/46954_1 /TAXON_ID=2985 /ORGANISM="Ochromonas sp, Strain CCMP1899" /LENGTH=317 /DNA_ID=CAMNT_0007019709 /DNA_START=139 /DNA_END=1092 /DNA_ORIENTATION=-